GPGGRRAIAASADDLRHREAAEAARRQEDDLAVREVRRERERDDVLRGRGERDDDQLGASDGGAEVGGRGGDRDLARTARVLEDDRRSRAERAQRFGVAPPERDLVSRG